MTTLLRVSRWIGMFVALLMVVPVWVSSAGETPHGAIATVHPVATEIAREIFHQGGNAIDAAVAAGLTLGVVDGENSGVGGGCFMLLRLRDGRVLVLDGREMAPAKASPDMFQTNGVPDPRLSQTGPLAVGIPGSLAVYEEVVRRFGKLSLRRSLLAAAEVAERGVQVQKGYVGRLAEVAREIREDPGSRAIFLHPDGQLLEAGERLVQPDLARSYRAMARDGVRWFYRGDFAHQVGTWMQEHGGRVTAQDFSEYRFQMREPVRTTYRGYEIVGFPPPSSGGVHVAQILNLLERFDLKSMGRRSPEFVHVVAECMKRAFADRAYWLGDPDFVHVPRGLVDKSYADRLASSIDLSKTAPVSDHGTPSDATENYYGKHTTHFTTADDAGNWVACTATVNTTFGAKVVVPGTGIVLNNQMDDFATGAGTGNFFGLVGGSANAVAPRKRPLSSMSPTLVFKNGKPILTTGAAGGPTIISQTVLVIIGVLDFGLSVDQALAEPRFHHQWKPDELMLEGGFGSQVGEALQAKGHSIHWMNTLGVSQAIEYKDGGFRAAFDPRVEGKSEAW